jgi:hypothetical protein
MQTNKFQCRHDFGFCFLGRRGLFHLAAGRLGFCMGGLTVFACRPKLFVFRFTAVINKEENTGDCQIKMRDKQRARLRKAPHSGTVLLWLGISALGARLLPGMWGFTHTGPLFIPHFYLTIASIKAIETAVREK